MNWKSCLIVSFFVVSCGSESIEDLDKRNEDWCWFVAEDGDAKWVRVSDNGSLKNGDFTTFYFNGNIRKRERLKNGEQVDTTRLYDIQGNLIADKFFQKGVLSTLFIKNGPYKFCHPNGKVKEEGFVQNLRDFKFWKQYYEDGRLELSGKVQDGVSIEKWYFPNGSLRLDETRVNDKRHGLARSYYENGKLECSVNFEKGVPEGEYYSYHKNGRLKQSCNYSHGLANGEVKHYFENGNLEWSVHYINDTLQGTKVLYFASGGIRKTGPMVNGEPAGEWKEYSEDGKLLHKWTVN